MSLPKYRLQPVLDSKEKKKKDAEQALAEARKELAKQQQLLQERENDVLKAVETKQEFTAQFMEKMDQGMDLPKITQGKAYIEVLKQKIVTAKKKVEDQKKVVALSEKKVETAIGKLTETTKEMKVIEKHKENWIDTEKRELEAKEEKEQEEVAQNIYQQSRRRHS